MVSGPTRVDAPQRDFELPVSMQRGRIYVITARQMNADVVLSIVDPQGKQVISVDSPTRRLGSEVAMLAPSVAGSYRIRTRSRRAQGRWGFVDITVARLHEHPLRTSLQLMELETNAGVQFALATESSRKEAATLLSTALEGVGRPDSSIDAARLALKLGWLRYTWQEQWQEAKDLAVQCRTRFVDGNDPGLAASALLLDALARLEIAQEAPAPEQGQQLEATIEAFEAVGKEFAGLGLEYERSYAHNNIGLAQHFGGNPDAAVTTFRRAAADFAAQEERAGEAMALQNVGWVELEQGNYVEARRSLDAALVPMRHFENPAQRLFILNNLALANSILGDSETAMDLYGRSYELAIELGEASEQARALHGLGAAYVRAGQPERARSLFEQALELRKRGRARVTTLIALGNLLRDEGEVARATALHGEARELATLPLDRAKALVAVGRDMDASGDPGGALTTLAGAAREAVGDYNEITGIAHVESARVLLKLARPRDAIRALDLGVEIHRKNGSAVHLAQSLGMRARARRQEGDAAGARNDIAAALAQSEAARARLANPDLRATFLAARPAILEEQLVQLTADVAGKSEQVRTVPERSLLAMERWRAAALKDRLRVVTVTADDGIEAERRRLADTLVSSAYQLEALRDQRRPNAALIRTLAASIARDEASLDRIDALQSATLRGTAPERFDAAALHALRKQLRDEVVLAYFIGQESGWRWSVRRDGVELALLHGRVELGRLVRAAVSCWSQPPSPRSFGADPCIDHASALAAALLGAGAIQARDKAVIVVPDGFLAGVPFAALPVERRRTDRLLIDDRAVQLAPSVSLLRRAEAPSKAAGASIAIVADPVYSLDDPRMPKAPANAVERVSLNRLSGSADEAAAIESSWRGASLLLTGFDATRDALLDRLLGKFDVVHIASHAMADPRDAELSRIELARFDREGRRLQGAVAPRDLRATRLNGAVIVLSGCETALGRELGSEGVLGLSHALMSAGAHRVIAGLWKVSDRATSRLVRELYAQQPGAQPDARAVRAAQLELRASSEFAAAYFWAGMQVVSMEF